MPAILAAMPACRHAALLTVYAMVAFITFIIVIVTLLAAIIAY